MTSPQLSVHQHPFQACVSIHLLPSINTLQHQLTEADARQLRVPLRETRTRRKKKNLHRSKAKGKICAAIRLKGTITKSSTLSNLSLTWLEILQDDVRVHIIGLLRPLLKPRAQISALFRPVSQLGPGKNSTVRRKIHQDSIGLVHALSSSAILGWLTYDQVQFPLSFYVLLGMPWNSSAILPQSSLINHLYRF